MSRIAIIVGHPRNGSFCQALAESYLAGARASGHEAELFSAGAMNFNPILREGFEKPQPLEPDLQLLHDVMLAADHLVFVFPLWLGGLPALLKGLLERVLQPDLVESSKQKRFIKLLKGKSARMIVTMAMPAVVYRLWFRSHALKMLKRNILGYMGVSPVRSTIIGGVEEIGDHGRRRWLKTIEKMGKRAA